MMWSEKEYQTGLLRQKAPGQFYKIYLPRSDMEKYEIFSPGLRVVQIESKSWQTTGVPPGKNKHIITYASMERGQGPMTIAAL